MINGDSSKITSKQSEDIIKLFSTIDTTEDIESDLTPVQEFYKNTSIFVTGCTGFLGQILLEKLLRSCPVSKIYVLIRKKKGKELETRLKEMFEDPIFQRIRNQYPERWEKVLPIEGDCALPDLGLGDQDKKLLKDEIDIVFHVAATVRFDEKLKTAVITNVRALRDLLRVAHQMTRLKSFLYVSTAYSNCIHDTIEEDFYPPAANYKGIIEAAESLSDEILDKITPSVVGKYPNTYTFTKQIAEDVVKQEGQGLPVGVQRPSVVISTYKEPIRGWVNNIYGVSGAVVASGLGVMRVMYCNPERSCNVVPVDMCVNSLIASAWDVAERFQESRKSKMTAKIPVYNFESSNDSPLLWKELMLLIEKYGLDFTPLKVMWWYVFSLEASYYTYRFKKFFLHTIPSLLIDAILFCMGKPTMMVQIYKKIDKLNNVLAFFCTNEWTFNSKNVQTVIEKMTKRDRRIFFSDLRQLDWDEYFKCYAIGERIYLVKDPLDTIPATRRKRARLYWAHQSVKVIVSVLLLWAAWTLLSFVFKHVF